MEAGGWFHFLTTSVFVVEGGGGSVLVGEMSVSLWRVCSFVELTCRGPMNESEVAMAFPVSSMRLGCTVAELEERARVWDWMEEQQGAANGGGQQLLVMNMKLLSGCVGGFQAAFSKLFGDPTLRLSYRDVQGLRLRQGRHPHSSVPPFVLTCMKPAVVVVIDENVVVSDRVAFQRSEVKMSDGVEDRWIMGQRVYRIQQGNRIAVLPPFVLATFVFVFDEA